MEHSKRARSPLAIAAVLCASGAAAQPPARAPSPAAATGVRIERQEWQKDVDGDAPIRAIEVRNDHGDIRARLTGERRLEALAVIQRLGAGSERVGFTVERRGEVVALLVAYPPGRVQDADPDPPKAAFDRLDLTLFVPEGVAFSARTLRGIVEARGLASDVAASTLAGAVFVSTSGGARVQTGSGDVTALLAPGPGRAPLLLESQSGAIWIQLPAKPDLDVRVETQGRVVSDFRLAPGEQRPGAPLEGRLGRGGRTLLVYSGSGDVELKRAPQ